MPDSNGRPFLHELRLDAEFLNRELAERGLPEPIPNYTRMRKAELEYQVSKHQKDIDECLAEYGFYLEEVV